MNIMTDMTYDECWIGIRQFKNTSENQWEDFYWVDGSPISYDYYLPPWKSGKLTYHGDQVWSLTRFHSVDFSKSRKKCVFNKRTIKVCVNRC